jgi:hypothetical protein
MMAKGGLAMARGPQQVCSTSLLVGPAYAELQHTSRGRPVAQQRRVQQKLRKAKTACFAVGKSPMLLGDVGHARAQAQAQSAIGSPLTLQHALGASML